MDWGDLKKSIIEIVNDSALADEHKVESIYELCVEFYEEEEEDDDYEMTFTPDEEVLDKIEAHKAFEELKKKLNGGNDVQ